MQFDVSRGIISTPEWSIQLADGWRAEEREDYVALLNEFPHTLLRLTTFALPLE